MFVTKKTLELHIEYMESEFKILNERYWELRNKHQRLLDYLELNESTDEIRLTKKRVLGKEAPK